jgi:hypothetical protein
MQDELVYRYIPLATLFAALGIIFPFFFHLVGLGKAFMPMFLPIVMGSVLLPPSLAISIAFLTPTVSFLFTGMPPIYPPILPVVMVELILVSFVVSFLYFKKNVSIWLTLIIALGIDRIALFIFVFVIAPFIELPKEIFSLAAVIYGFPGIMLILAVVPMTLRFLKQKYPSLIRR